MKWNNGFQTRRFEKRMEKQDREYRALGMTEEQIKAIHDFDLEVFLSDRRFAEHNQQLDLTTDDMDDEGQCPLMKDFAENLSDQLRLEIADRFWWIQEAEDGCLLKAICEMTETQKLILTLLAFEERSQKEIGQILAKSQQAISRQLKEIKEILLKNGFGSQGGNDNEK